MSTCCIFMMSNSQIQVNITLPKVFLRCRCVNRIDLVRTRFTYLENLSVLRCDSQRDTACPQPVTKDETSSPLGNSWIRSEAFEVSCMECFCVFRPYRSSSPFDALQFSNSRPPNRSIVKRSAIRIDFVQSYCKYVLFNDELLDYLPFFKERNISVINSAPTAMSLLTNSPQIPTWHPADDRVKRICLDAGSFCKVRLFFNSFHDHSLLTSRAAGLSERSLENHTSWLNIKISERSIVRYKTGILIVNSNCWRSV